MKSTTSSLIRWSITAVMTVIALVSINIARSANGQVRRVVELSQRSDNTFMKAMDILMESRKLNTETLELRSNLRTPSIDQVLTLCEKQGMSNFVVTVTAERNGLFVTSLIKNGQAEVFGGDVKIIKVAPGTMRDL